MINSNNLHLNIISPKTLTMIEQLYNEDNKAILIDLEYDDEDNKCDIEDDSTTKLSSHEDYITIKKMLNRQWTSITLDDINTLRVLDIHAMCEENKFRCHIPCTSRKYYKAKITIVDTRYNIPHVTILLYRNEFDVCYDEFEDSYHTTEDGSELTRILQRS